jgi:hypothetical protein
LVNFLQKHLFAREKRQDGFLHCMILLRQGRLDPLFAPGAEKKQQQKIEIFPVLSLIVVINIHSRSVFCGSRPCCKKPSVKLLGNNRL